VRDFRFVMVSHCKSFGAKSLIKVDIPELGTEKSYSKADHYVAISRARQDLALFVRKEFKKPEKPIEPAEYEPITA
jgi:hypothetical protein